MNIVYRLTNLSKTSGKRFYVGSVQECKVVDSGDGVRVIVKVHTGKRYYGSSACEEIRGDILRGDVFTAEILEDVGNCDRAELSAAEVKWLKQLRAAESEDYYNKSNRAINVSKMTLVRNLANPYGETVLQLAKNKSSAGKRDATAIEFGFRNFGELCFDAHRELAICNGNFAQAAKKYGKHKGYVRVMLKDYDMEKAKNDLLVEGMQERVRGLVLENCSLFFACKMLGIEAPAGRILLGDYSATREFSVALTHGKTEEELSLEITKRVLDGEGLREISNSLGITYTSAKRYFFRFIRKRLKSSDL